LEAIELSILQEHIKYISEEVLLRILSSFTEATGLRALIIDCEGKPLLSIGQRRDCRFCRIIKSDPVGENKCCGSYARAGAESAKFGEPYIFRCHAGLIAFAAPIVVDGEQVGSIICGQVLMWEPEDFFWEEIAEMTAGLNIKISDLVEAVREMKVISGRKVQAAADLLYVVANQIMQIGALALEQNKEISLRQAQLAEEMSTRKQLEKKLQLVEGRIYGGFSLQREKELLGKIRLRDRDGAYQVLNRLVSQTMERYLFQPRLFRTRMMELVVVMSRAAVETGDDLDELLTLNSQYIEEILQADKVDVFCSCIFKVLNRLMDRVCTVSNNLQVVDQATRYIREHFDKNLTLNDIAHAVYISPYYLSHIFKEQLNCTVIDYLTSVRIEEAKKLLRKKGISIVNVAERIGYSDSGYFSKVFKKSEGVTPSAFKRQLI
jgi:two-component system response regulator YesN